MSKIFSRSPINNKVESQSELLTRKFQQCVTSEQDFVRNVGFFLEKIKVKEYEILLRAVDRVKSTIKSNKSSEPERFLSLLLLKTLMECEETLEIARYSATKILRRLKILAEKGFLSHEKKGFSPFFFGKKNKTPEINKTNKLFFNYY